MGKKTRNYDPIGSIFVKDSSPLNWLFVLFNTMQEAVRTDHLGRIVPSLAEDFSWISDTTLQLKLREGVFFQNGECFMADHVIRALTEAHKWMAPHPPGTWVNFPRETTFEEVNRFTVNLHFPKTEGLAAGKLRGYHFPNFLFWRELGFGYKNLGSAEGHW